MFATTAVISVVMYFAAVGVYGLRTAGNSVSEAVDVLTEKEFALYDGTVVLGSSVIYVVEKFDEEDFIRVVTKENRFGFQEFSQIRNPLSPNYVDSTAQFVGKLYKNAGGYTVGISFTEIGASPADSLLSYEDRVLFKNQLDELEVYEQDPYQLVQKLEDEKTVLQDKFNTIQNQLNQAVEQHEDSVANTQRYNNLAIYGAEADRELLSSLQKQLETVQLEIDNQIDVMITQIEEYKQSLQ